MPENFSMDELQRLQNEAMNRAREMQKKAQNIGKQSANSRRKPANPSKFKMDQKQISKPPAEHKKAMSNLFESLMEDSDKSLILILILILSTEDADPGIILALMYIIL